MKFDKKMIQDEDQYRNSIFMKYLEIPLHLKKKQLKDVTLFSGYKILKPSQYSLSPINTSLELKDKRNKYYLKNKKINNINLDRIRDKDKFYFISPKILDRSIKINKTRVSQFLYDKDDPFSLKRNINKKKNQLLSESFDNPQILRLWKNSSTKRDYRIKFPKITIAKIKRQIEKKRIMCHGM